MDGKLLARIGAIAFVAIAITATAIELTREEEGDARPSAAPAVAAAADPHRAELIRCQRLGEAGEEGAVRRMDRAVANPHEGDEVGGLDALVVHEDAAAQLLSIIINVGSNEIASRFGS